MERGRIIIGSAFVGFVTYLVVKFIRMVNEPLDEFHHKDSFTIGEPIIFTPLPQQPKTPPFKKQRQIKLKPKTTRIK